MKGEDKMLLAEIPPKRLESVCHMLVEGTRDFFREPLHTILHKYERSDTESNRIREIWTCAVKSAKAGNLKRKPRAFDFFGAVKEYEK